MPTSRRHLTAPDGARSIASVRVSRHRFSLALIGHSADTNADEQALCAA
jgi:hypothetical protein